MRERFREAAADMARDRLLEKIQTETRRAQLVNLVTELRAEMRAKEDAAGRQVRCRVPPRAKRRRQFGKRVARSCEAANQPQSWELVNAFVAESERSNFVVRR